MRFFILAYWDLAASYSADVMLTTQNANSLR